MKLKLFPTLVSALCTLITAGLSTLFTQLGMTAFSALTPSPLQPPSIVFPIVWAVIYLLTFASAALYFSNNQDVTAVILFALMAVLNVAWTVAAFTLLMLSAGVWILIAYTIVTVLLIYRLFKSEPISSRLLVPHAVWLGLALILNYSLAMLN